MSTVVDKLQMRMLHAMISAAEHDVERRQAALPIDQLEEALRGPRDSRPFQEALSRPGLSVVAEFKRRSPSARDIASKADVGRQVASYQRAGAAALSVLTDREHFGGKLEDLESARQSSDLPILRKDFIIDRYQLFEAAVFGADAVLLIAAVLDSDLLSELYGEARELDLDCMVEVRTPDELDRALALDADIIGINNRDLETLKVDIERTFELLTDVPTGKTVVSESGIEDPAQISRLKDAGVDAVLIGSALMKSADPEALTRELTGVDEGTREHHLP